MQIHQLHSARKRGKSRRIGRGGKRGTYSGRGSKGQKSRAGARIKPDFRGGDNPVWKLFPKQRGATKKTKIKHAKLRVRQEKPVTVNLSLLNLLFRDGDKISPKILVRRGVIKGAREIKILGDGELNRKLIFFGFEFSKQARDKIERAGGVIK